MNAPSTSDWLLLVISLPGRRGTARMRIWRALKSTGAAVLRDGAYLLPFRDATRQAFDEQARAVRTAGGSAHVLEINASNAEQEREFRALFDRGAEYARLLETVRKERALLQRRRSRTGKSSASVLRREFEAVCATDYFPGPAAEHVRAALAELEAQILAQASPGEPAAQRGPIERRDAKAFRGRTWATRARPWVDRLASAWLIRRFIDPKAKIMWLKDVKRCPRRALGFDFDGATFSHVGARVTFEHLLASFGLENDAALLRLGHLVHCLDVGGAPAPEAQGLAAILSGARARLPDDDPLLAEACRVFDHLYRAYQEE